VLGLSVFYQYVRTAALNQQLTKAASYSSAFTTELFASCVHTKCLLVKKCRIPSPASEIQRYRKCFYECTDMFITDLLLFSFVSRTQYASYNRGLCLPRDHTKPVMSCQLDTSELVELLQQSAVEYLTNCLQLQARECGTVYGIVIVTTHFEALYANKCGKYRRCLQLLSAHDFRALLNGIIGTGLFISMIPSYPEFIQLMDDNIASLVGLTLIVNTSIRDVPEHLLITQLCLSLYLMSQCQMKLHHSAKSLAQTLNYVEVARRQDYHRDFTLNQLLLKLAERKIRRYLVISQKCFTIFNVVSRYVSCRQTVITSVGDLHC